MIKIDKTVYDKPEKSDGKRVLVMSLWPRGIKKEKVDFWIKELGTLRPIIKKWKAQEIAWSQVVKEYEKVLQTHHDALLNLAKLAGGGDVTLLCSCKDVNYCHRKLLAERVEAMLANNVKF